MKKFLFLLLISVSVFGQTPTRKLEGFGAGFITNDMAPSAIIEARSTDKGVLFTRVTTTQRNAISSPATSLLIFNTTVGRFQYYDGSVWVDFLTGSAIPTSSTWGEVMINGNITETNAQFNAGAGIDFFDGVYTLNLMQNTLSANRNLGFPNASGTLVANINGYTANTSGYVSLPTPNLQQVTDIGNEVTRGAEEVFVKFKTSENVFAQISSDDDGYVNLEVQADIGEKTSYEHGAISYQKSGVNRDLLFPDYDGVLGYIQKQVTTNQTSVNHFNYTSSNVTNVTFTDPLDPFANVGYTVFAFKGTITIGGIEYPEKSLVYRFYNGTTWVTDVITSVASDFISQSITNGVTDKAPSEDVVFDALALKQDTLTENNFGSFANSLTAKTTPVDADLINIVDTADSNKQKKVTSSNYWSNYFKGKADAIYATISNLALKADIASPTFTGTVTTPAIIVSSETASRLAIIDASKNVKSADTATYPSLTELAYVKGVTSGVQTQLDTKADISIIDRYKKRVQFFTDFDCLASNITGLIHNNSGTGATAVLSTNTIPARQSNQIGFCQYQTGTNAAGYLFHQPQITNYHFAFGGGVWYYETSVLVDDLSTSGERYRFLAGFGTSAFNNSEVDCVMFTYDEGGVENGTSATGNWQVVTCANSVRTGTVTNTGVAVVADTWVTLRIEINAAATSVVYKINGTTVATHTSNIPTFANSRFLSVKQGIAKSIGTTNRSVFCDYLGYEGILTTPR